jgi:Type ISP C-terminal specificity domain
VGLTPEQALEHPGETTCDIYLNEPACWQNIPARHWGYCIGGYQVVKKWLSNREHNLLGRPMTLDEAREKWQALVESPGLMSEGGGVPIPKIFFFRTCGLEAGCVRVWPRLAKGEEPITQGR